MKPHPGRAAWRRPALAALGVALIAGCGAEAPPIPLFPASGRVLVGDRPAAGVEVRLFDAARPTDPDAPHPYATTDDEGRFRLSTFRDGDGAPAGEFAAMLLWPDGPPGPGGPVDRFGNAFTNPAKSPYRATIPAGGAELEPFRVAPAALRPPAPPRRPGAG